MTLTYYVERKSATEVERVVVVEQRRWIDVGSGRTLDIDRIDDAADLETLVVESLSHPGELALGRCLRDPLARGPATPAQRPAVLVGHTVELSVAGGATVRGTITGVRDDGDHKVVIIAADHGRTAMVREDAIRSARYLGAGGPGVRCEIARGSGRHLVRVLYTTGALGFRAEHGVHAVLDVDGVGSAQIAPRFTVDTPPWQVVADVALYDGVPGGQRTPHLVFRGPIKLGGEPVVVASPPRHAAARIDSVYRGAVSTPGEAPSEPYWRHGSTADVWDWLELATGDDALPAGRVMLDVARAGQPPAPLAVDEAGIDRGSPDATSGAVRIRLWPSPDLRGQRVKTPITSTGTTLAESFLFSVSNAGDRTRLVVIEEELRPGRQRRVLHAWPRKPSVRDGVLRMRVSVDPRKATQAGYVVEYGF